MEGELWSVVHVHPPCRKLAVMVLRERGGILFGIIVLRERGGVLLGIIVLDREREVGYYLG